MIALVSIALLAVVTLWVFGYIEVVHEEQAHFLVILLGPLGIVIRWQRGE